MPKAEQEAEKFFQEEVIKVARQLWPAAENGGSTIVDGKERDGVLISEDLVCLIECTVSRSKEKARQDINKLLTLYERYRKDYLHKAIKAWFVTREEPTPDQRSVAEATQSKVVAISFDQFRSKLIDAAAYIRERERYAFGSIKDPDSGSTTETNSYVQLDIIQHPDNTMLTVNDISNALKDGLRFILQGDYGAGKSMTMREIFLNLAKKYRANKIQCFPILLNLRDHQGQINPAEALERHGRNIGLQHPSHLIRAWRGGYAILMLDGFDEIATPGWTGQIKKLRYIRRRSVEAIRAFIKESPPGTGIIVSGRAHFFDSPNEMHSALGVESNFKVLSLNDFNEEQVKTYLSRRNWNGVIPSWLPSRPLLLGYLAARDLLKQTLGLETDASPSAGWHALFDKIFHREADIETGIDGDTARRIIERLATIARKSQDGLGSLTYENIVQAFEEVCGYSPDDRALVLLQRLPGLGVRSDDGSRAFIDSDFADVARAGDIFHYIENPHGEELHDPPSWQCLLQDLGVETVAHRINLMSTPYKKVFVAAQRASQKQSYDGVTMDILRIAQELNAGANSLGGKFIISEAMIPVLTVPEGENTWSDVEFRDCVIGELDIALAEPVNHQPRFLRCLIGNLRNASPHVQTNIESLPYFNDCTVEHFDSGPSTNSEILNLPISIGTRVLLTVLRKLYVQKGTGRKESALFRGMDHRARELVPNVLNLLQRERLAIKSRAGEQTIWLPERSSTARIRQLLANPVASDDPLIQKSQEID